MALQLSDKLRNLEKHIAHVTTLFQASIYQEHHQRSQRYENENRNQLNEVIASNASYHSSKNPSENGSNVYHGYSNDYNHEYGSVLDPFSSPVPPSESCFTRKLNVFPLPGED